MSFGLIESSGANMLLYVTDHHTYQGVVRTPAGFTDAEYITYINKNLTKLKFENNTARYESIFVSMAEMIPEITIQELNQKIKRLEDIVGSILFNTNQGAIRSIRKHGCSFQHCETHDMFELHELSDSDE